MNQKPNPSRFHRAEALQELWEAKGSYEKKPMFRQHPQQPEQQQQHQQHWRQDTWSGASEGISSERNDGESSYIRDGTKHTKQSWGESGESRQLTRNPQRYSSEGSEASGNLSFISKVVCYNCKNPGHIKCDCQEKHSLGRV